MILIPEIETVVILVPRTGSGSLRRAIAEHYPKSTLLYRHMEADGVPAGYDRWRKVGVVRHPLERLWSLYKFCLRFEEWYGQHSDQDRAFVDAILRSVDMPFSEWILTNQTPFTTPYDSSPKGRFWPSYTVRHALPENRKSQFVYLRPDLGTQVIRFDRRHVLMDRLGLKFMIQHNQTDKVPVPVLTPEAKAYMRQAFAWDYAQVGE